MLLVLVLLFTISLVMSYHHPHHLFGQAYSHVYDYVYVVS